MFGNKDYATKKYVDSQIDHIKEIIADDVDRAFEHADHSVENVFDHVGKLDSVYTEEFQGLKTWAHSCNKKIGELNKSMKNMEDLIKFMKDSKGRLEAMDQLLDVLSRDNKKNNSSLDDLVERLDLVEQYQQKDPFWGRRVREIERENKEWHGKSKGNEHTPNDQVSDAGSDDSWHDEPDRDHGHVVIHSPREGGYSTRR